jgi:hypothetical protein
MADAVRLAALIELLAARGTRDDAAQPAADLGFDRQKPTPYPVLPWTPRIAAAAGAQLLTHLGQRAPASVQRVLREVGPVEVHESAIGAALDQPVLGLPLNQLEGLQRIEAIGDMLWFGDRLARGVEVRARWDDLALYGCADLATPDEPIWLMYVPGYEGPWILPLSASFEGVLGVYLTGVDAMLGLMNDRFAELLGELGAVDDALKPHVLAALDEVDRTCIAFGNRAEVQMRNEHAADFRSPTLVEGAKHARGRVWRMRQLLSSAS